MCGVAEIHWAQWLSVTVPSVFTRVSVGTCRVYIAEEGGIIRNFMSDLAKGSAGRPISVGVLFTNKSVPLCPVLLCSQR